MLSASPARGITIKHPERERRVLERGGWAATELIAPTLAGAPRSAVPPGSRR